MAEAKLEEMEETCREIGTVIGSALPPETGFALMMFNHGEKGHMTYVSNASREEMIEALKELIARLETKTTAPHGAPSHPMNKRNDA